MRLSELGDAITLPRSQASSMDGGTVSPSRSKTVTS
jgi:hypothetical protein